MRRHGRMETWVCGSLTRRRPAFCRSGVRHRGGVNLVEAFAWNVGTCIAMLRKESK